MTAQEPLRPSTLNGWKDIAAYLGKSVRSVQRWEATLGLPIHRIHTSDGHIVYADRDEIDRWRSARDTPRSATVPVEADRLTPARRRTPPRLSVTAGVCATLAATMLAFAAGACWQGTQQLAATPAAVRSWPGP
jgi:hypothetical protein